MAAEIVNPRSDSTTDSGIQRTSAADTGADEPFDPAFALHRGGKMAVQSTVPIRDKDDLSLAYTPGVAKVCSAIAADPEARPRLHLEVPGRGRRDGRHRRARPR